MRNFSIILAYIGIVIVCIVLSTATYAYVTYEEEEKKVVDETYEELLHVEYTETSNISMFNAKAGDEFVKKFSVKNVSKTTFCVCNKFDNPNAIANIITFLNSFLKNKLFFKSSLSTPLQ